MSLSQHLGELRERVVKSLLAILVLFFVALFFSSQILNFLKGPLAAALPDTADVLHFTGPMEVFLATIKVSLLASFIFSCPVWIYQFWRFLEPALYPGERRYVLPFIFASIVLFCLGVLFSYYGIFPLALEFLMSLGMEVGRPIITISDYLSVLMIMIFGFGIVFEAPLVLVLLATLDLVSAKLLSQYRRFVIILILIISAIFTPPDPLSQIGMAIPLYLMYELSIVIIKKMEKRKAPAA